MTRAIFRKRVIYSTLLFMVITQFMGSAFAQTGGKISGTVKDPSQAVVPGAEVNLINQTTKAAQTTHTDNDGSYSFPIVPVGAYDLKINAAGFKPYERTGVTVNINSSLMEDISLDLGEHAETVTVDASNSNHVESAETELGETINSKKITAVPLNGRSYTDLLAVQSGVTPITTGNSQNGSSGGSFATAISPSGGENTGQFSISGQRESANGFVLNGVDVVESIAGAAAIVPNLDSISEFRILTTNSDAQFGNYSGGLINVVTKSGENKLHGSVFEFLRNTNLDARGYFDTTRPKFIQNQFGATIGGPIKHSKIFFFGDYQGTRNVQGIETSQILVPSLQDRMGNLSDIASALAYNPASGSQKGLVQGSYFAGILSQRLNYPVTVGEPYYTQGCTASSQCVFPNAVIPQNAWSTPAKYLLQYIPAPNNGTYFQTSANTQRLNDNKGSARMDAQTKYGSFSAYYFIDPYSLDSPYPTAQGGANVPGFSAHNQGKAQLFVLSYTKPIGSMMVNEARLSYLRDTNLLGQPTGGTGVSPQQQGFSSVSQGGYLVQTPQYAGVQSVVFNNYTIGTTPFTQNQINDVYEGSDNFTKSFGKHTMKFGVDMHFDHVKQAINLYSNGQFSFFGDETGLDFADFLIGIPSSFSQGYTPPFRDISRYGGLYAQDSWKVTPTLVVNYGLRWEYIRPWSEERNQAAGLIPGQNSQTFPGAPEGLVYPGDNGLPSTIAPTPLNDFSPRIGIAYSPAWNSCWLARLTGGPGNFSIRTGFGRYFTAIEGAVLSYSTGDAPYGSTYTSTERPLFESPFIGALTGTQYQQPFPMPEPPANVSPEHPYQVNWSQYLPINGEDTYYYKNRTPYSENYYLSLQRQFAHNTVLGISYVGSEGHHLITLLSASPGVPSTCLSVSQASQIESGSATCGPFGENGVYTRADGTVINGTRSPFGNDIASSPYFYNFGNSAYNSLQVTVNHTSKRLNLLGGYTYGKSIDNASSLQEQLYPYDHNFRRSISSFDLRHSFVASYRYELPFDQYFSSNRLTKGWALTGITRFSTGVPITFYSFDDNSLLGTGNNGVNNIGSDEPNYTPGPLHLNHNPRNGQPYFNTSLFSVAPLGSPGNSKRRMFSGPGINNWDMALLKTLPLSESKSFEFRFETFNTFNHAQFDGAGSVNGNINSSTFGQVQSAASPRLCQVAAKFNF